MRQFCLALLMLGVLAMPVQAQIVCPGPAMAYEPLTDEVITVSTVAIGFTAAKLVGAAAALVTVEAQPLNWTLVTAPTATDGHLLVAGDTRTFCGTATLAAFLAIRTGGTNSKIAVTYFKAR